MKTNQGLIKMIIIIIVALILLGYLGFDIKKAIEAPATQSNLSYSQQVASTTWNRYLKGPAIYIWDKVFVNLIWDPAINNLKKMGDDPKKDDGGQKILI